MGTKSLLQFVVYYSEKTQCKITTDDPTDNFWQVCKFIPQILALVQLNLPRFLAQYCHRRELWVWRWDYDRPASQPHQASPVSNSISSSWGLCFPVLKKPSPLQGRQSDAGDPETSYWGKQRRPPEPDGLRSFRVSLGYGSESALPSWHFQRSPSSC